MIFFLVLVSIPGVEAITSYDILVEGDDILVNVTFELYTSSPGEKVNYWTTGFSLPPNSQVLGLSDSKGEITNYTVSGEKIFLETNKGGLKEKEVVSLLFRAIKIVNKEYDPLKKLNLSLAAFGDVRKDVPDEKTFVTVRSEENIISFLVSFGFISQQKEKEVMFAGEGPVGFTVFFGEGRGYKHYVLFGQEGNVTVADEAYGIIAAVNGFIPVFERFPVVALEDKEYDEKITDWSAGEFRGGVIILRISTFGKDSFPATVLHETTHGFNERALRWQKTEVTWFDEGVAKYVEFLINKKSGVRQAEIFGSPVQWRQGLKIFTLPSRSTPDELWDYYQEGNFMETWNPHNPQTREFGYAFSELVIRDFIKREGPDALHEVFQGLLKIRKEAETAEAYNSVILGILDSDFRPCYADSREAFDSCLEEINVMDPPIPKNVVIKGETVEIVIPDIEAPEEEPLHISFIQRILDFLDSLISAIRGFLGL